MNNHTMPALTDEYRARLIEVATKRLGQYRSMKQAQESATVRPRGGINFDYQVSIDLMLITLASLASEPVKTKLKYSSVLAKFIGESNEVESVHCLIHGNTPDYPSNDEAYSEAKKMAGDLYTAPPVPALKQIELPKSERLDGNGYGYYFDMNDVFDALDAAGANYKVKE